jgi:hypothetical protein
MNRLTCGPCEPRAREYGTSDGSDISRLSLMSTPDMPNETPVPRHRSRSGLGQPLGERAVYERHPTRSLRHAAKPRSRQGVEQERGTPQSSSTGGLAASRRSATWRPRLVRATTHNQTREHNRTFEQFSVWNFGYWLHFLSWLGQSLSTILLGLNVLGLAQGVEEKYQGNITIFALLLRA